MFAKLAGEIRVNFFIIPLIIPVREGGLINECVNLVKVVLKFFTLQN